MYIKELHEKLSQLNSEIEEMLNITKYKDDFSLSTVTYDHANADDTMLYNEFCSIFTHFDYVHTALNYLSQPVTQEGILHFVGDGKHTMNGIDLNPDNLVEILLYDEETHTLQWRPILLHKKSNYDGKKARIRHYKK